MIRPRLDQAFVNGSLASPAGKVPRVTAALSRRDRWGSIKARWAVGRMHYTVEPGLYALGNPDSESPVLVTANYKMSFDRLREPLPGLNAWILVLNTHGINVWCAAGKGSFGTAELVERIRTSGLAQVVRHRQLILPQLGAPGVAGFQVKRLSGFEVVFGPIRSRDIPAFLASGMKATPEMRRKTFDFRERAVLIPVELVASLKVALILLPALFLLGGLGGPGAFWQTALDHGLLAVLAMLGAIAAGAVATPLLLPWLPGRAFAFKGMVTGLAAASLIAAWRWETMANWPGRLEVLGWLLIVPAVSAYLGMNFTGSSSYTSLSGVKREMRWAVPSEIAAAALGICLWIGSRLAA